MGYAKTWDDFYDRAQRLFLLNPDSARYSFKYRAQEAKLVLTVSNQGENLKFRTDQRADLRRMDALTQWMLVTMSSKKSSEELRKESVALSESN